MGKGWSPPSLASCFCACDVHGSYQNGSLFHFCPTLLIKSNNNNKKKPLRVGNKDDLLLLKWYAARIELHLKCACLPLMICVFIASLLRGWCDLNLLLQVPLWGTTDTVLLVEKKLVSFFSVLVFSCFHLFSPSEPHAHTFAPTGLSDTRGWLMEMASEMWARCLHCSLDAWVWQIPARMALKFWPRATWKTLLQACLARSAWRAFQHLVQSLEDLGDGPHGYWSFSRVCFLTSYDSPMWFHFHLNEYSSHLWNPWPVIFLARQLQAPCLKASCSFRRSSTLHLRLSLT